MGRKLVWGMVSLAGTLSLGACGTGSKFPPVCPSLSLLRDASDLNRYTGSGRDLSELALSARITAVPANCVRDAPGKVRATLTVAVDATRGPAATSRTSRIPYFVAVTEGTQVLDEQDYEMTARFPSNLDTIQLSSDEISLLLPVTKDKSAAAYQVYVGFRLSPEELTSNRERNRR